MYFASRKHENNDKVITAALNKEPQRYVQTVEWKVNHIMHT